LIKYNQIQIQKNDNYKQTNQLNKNQVQNSQNFEKLVDSLNMIKYRLFRSFFEGLYFHINRSRLYFSGSEGRLSIHNLSQDINVNSANELDIQTSTHVNIQNKNSKSFMNDNSLVIMSAEANEENSDCKKDKLKESNNQNSWYVSASVDKFKLSNLN